MKKIIAYVCMVLVLALALASCGGFESPVSPDDNPNQNPDEPNDEKPVDPPGTESTDSNGLVYTMQNDYTYCVTDYINEETEIVIPSDYKGTPVTSIGDHAFEGCDKLTSVKILEGITSIGVSAFEKCYRITSISIPGSVLTIGDRAFYGCTGITSIVLPEGVTTVGKRAFMGCRFSSISLPNSLTSIFSNTFERCYDLEYNEYGHVYYLGNDTNPYVVLVKPVHSYVSPLEIAPSTKIILDSAFKDCLGIRDVVIPDGVVSIGVSAFSSGELTSIVIPDSVKNIAPSAFSFTFLSNAVISDSITSISCAMFEGCSKLTSVEIPASVTNIDKNAFKSCASLSEIRYHGTEEQWNAITKGDNWSQFSGEFTVIFNYGA